MKIFVADGCERIRNICRNHNIGILSSPSYWRNPTDISYILDNGAFIAWKNRTCWDELLFYSVVERMQKEKIVPYFVVVPDIVCGGKKSLDFSMDHIHNLPSGWAKYLPVQDGMTTQDIVLSGLAGIFVGGSIDWKWRTAREWCKFAHKNNILCHIGRVGTIKNYIRAEKCGADSVDGSGPTRNNRMDIPIRFMNMNQKTIYDFRS
jgi:hypothetical protein